MKILFHHGRIYPTAEKRFHHDFLLIKNGHVVSIGKRSEQPAFENVDQVVDLKGKTVLPGFHDPHIHLWKVGHMMTTMMDARGITSIDHLKSQMHEFGKRLKPDQWFLARGYNEAHLAENRHPSREDLDEVFPDRPAWLIRTCAHIAIANTKALELSGITDNVSVPKGGVAHRNDRGKLTGRFEESALGLVANRIPQPTLENYQEMILAAQQELLSMGVVSSTDPAVTPGLIGAYKDLELQSKLLMPTSMMAIRRPDGGTETLPLPERIDKENLQLRTIKLFSDGGLSGATAAQSRKYKTLDSKGVLRLTKDEIYELGIEACENGFQIGTHAIGDVAIEETISGYEKLNRDVPCLRPRIEHLALPSQDHLERLKSMDGISVPQPNFIYEIGDNFTKYLDDDFLSRTYPFMSMIDAGIVTAFSSDGPVIKEIAPLSGIQSAILRKTKSGKTIAVDESVSLEDTLKCYTQNAAYSNFRESVTGHLKPGMRADMILMESDIFSQDHSKISELTVDSTWIKGECSFRKS